MIVSKRRPSLQDHICIVTGGAQGIGWATAQALANRGALVHVCDLSEERLAQARIELEKVQWASRITLDRCDVTDRTAFEGWITSIHRSRDRIDMLVNNAAYVQWEDVLQMSVEQIERTMRVGYDAMVYGVKAVLPGMLSAGRGCIVNMGSIVGRVFVGSASAAYCAAKAAVDAYTQVLQIELRGTPVHVMLVRPATVAGTDFFRKHVPASRMPRLADFLPYLTPPEVAAAIIKGIDDKVAILNVPAYNSALQVAFGVAPGMLRWAMTLGGPGRRDYGAVEWSYRPDGETKE